MKRKTFFAALISIILFSFSCSTEKNTASTRFYHNLTTHYNVYFNGYVSFDAGMRKIEDMDEPYTQLLPVFKGENEKVPNLVNSDMDRAVKKSVKSIKMHSITVKPEIKKTNGRLTDEQEAFMSKTEYNKWIDDAYLLIGKAHYFKGEYRVALKSLQTILTKFRKEEIRFDAMLWVSRCYSALKEPRDAEKYLQTIKESPDYSGRLDYEIEMVYADISVKSKKYSEAAEKIQPIISKTRNKNKKARLHYILAQLYAKTDQNDLARKNYEIVIKLNPSYDMVFSSKINLAQAYESGQGGSKELKKSLSKMLKDDKNIDYQDQIYYALAEIDMKENDIILAEGNYLESARRSTSNVNQKAISFLALANIYFDRPNYLKAGAYFDSTMTVLSKDYEDYDKIAKTAENLSRLTDNLKIVSLEDSLQAIAKMNEDDRLQLINNLIAQAKADEAAAKNAGNTGYDPFRQGDYNNKETKGKWIFYNPQALSIGKNEFLKTWGKRRLEDHWRRSNKTVISTNEEQESDTTNRITDNKDPEFYLQDLPLTDSLMAISKERVAQALFAAGYTYESQMKAYPEAIETYNDFLTRYKDHTLVVEAYFNMYMIYYSKLKDSSKAEKYRQKILTEFPHSKYANILSDPNYLEKLKKTRDDINNMYEDVYTNYNSGNYNDVLSKIEEAKKLSPENDLIAGFLYFEALAEGSLGNQTKMKTILEELIIKYPNHKITAQAQKVLDMYNSGKHDPNYYSQDSEADSFYYVFITHPDSSKMINKVKFLLVDYTVEKFPSLDIKVSEKVLNKDKKQVFAKGFSKREDAKSLFSGIQSMNLYKEIKESDYSHFVISTKNYSKFEKLPITEKYLQFYNRYY